MINHSLFCIDNIDDSIRKTLKCFITIRILFILFCYMFSMFEHGIFRVDLYLDFSKYSQHIYPLKPLNGSMFFSTPYSENEG